MIEINPVVSVIVTTFNRKEYLKETVESILNQTYKNFEFIIVDNYSNYDFLSHIKSFNDERIRPFQNANDGIIAVNRNYGIKEAKGEYIAFCDDDDLWMENKMEVQLKFFNHKDIVGVGSSHTLIGDTKFYRNPQARSNKLLRFDDIIKKGGVPLSSLMIKNCGYLFDENKSLICVEDFDLQLSMILNSSKSILKIKEPLIFYRVPGHTLTSIRKLYNGINIISKYKSVLSFWQYKQLLHGYYINIGTHHLRNFQNKQALFFFLKCIFYSFPFIKYKEFLGLLISLLPKRIISYILHKYYKNK